MDAGARTMSVAVLIALDLTLTAWAAEPDVKRFRLDAPPEVRKIPELVRGKSNERVWIDRKRCEKAPCFDLPEGSFRNRS